MVRNILLVVGGLVTAVVIFVGLLYLGRALGIFGEETRRIVQEESRAYQEGMARNIDELCLEWDESGRAPDDPVRYTIRHRVSGYKGELPSHVQSCVNEAR